MAARRPAGPESQARTEPARLSSSSQLERKSEKDTNVQLQQELETLQQVHASINALHHMTIALHKTLQSVVENGNTLKDLNEGWKLFFRQNST